MQITLSKGTSLPPTLGTGKSSSFTYTGLDEKGSTVGRGQMEKFYSIFIDSMEDVPPIPHSKLYKIIFEENNTETTDMKKYDSLEPFEAVQLIDFQSLVEIDKILCSLKKPEECGGRIFINREGEVMISKAGITVKQTEYLVRIEKTFIVYSEEHFKLKFREHM